MATTNFNHITNPLVSSAQLIRFQNRSSSEVQSAHFAQSLLTQSAGILLRLPQEVVATSLVLLQRYRTVNATITKYSARTVSAACVYLAAKLSFTPLSPRSVVNVYAYLLSKSALPLWFANSNSNSNSNDGQRDCGHDPREYYVSEGSYEREKRDLFAAETEVLVGIGFDTQVALPHALALTYLQVLGASSTALAERVFEHLNGALLSPQMLYLTHQPNALAVAAIYLAAREVEVKLVEENWWEVFDVDREDLGFLVLALGSLGNFAHAEMERWKGKGVPLDV